MNVNIFFGWGYRHTFFFQTLIMQLTSWSPANEQEQLENICLSVFHLPLWRTTWPLLANQENSKGFFSLTKLIKALIANEKRACQHQKQRSEDGNYCKCECQIDNEMCSYQIPIYYFIGGINPFKINRLMPPLNWKRNLTWVHYVFVQQYFLAKFISSDYFKGLLCEKCLTRHYLFGKGETYFRQLKLFPLWQCNRQWMNDKCCCN